MQDTSNPNIELLNLTIAATPQSTIASMTLTAEILQMILYLKPNQTYLVHPKYIAHRAVKNLAIKEGNFKIKRLFIDALDEGLEN